MLEILIAILMTPSAKAEFLYALDRGSEVNRAKVVGGEVDCRFAASV